METEMSEFLEALFAQYTKTVRDGGDIVDAIADVLCPMGYTVVSNVFYVELCAEYYKYKEGR